MYLEIIMPSVKYKASFDLVESNKKMSKECILSFYLRLSRFNGSNSLTKRKKWVIWMHKLNLSFSTGKHLTKFYSELVC